MKLTEYLNLTGITRAEFASKIGVSPVAVGRYATGERTPRPRKMSAIIAATQGAVTANDFVKSIAQHSESASVTEVAA